MGGDPEPDTRHCGGPETYPTHIRRNVGAGSRPKLLLTPLPVRNCLRSDTQRNKHIPASGHGTVIFPMMHKASLLHTHKTLVTGNLFELLIMEHAQTLLFKARMLQDVGKMRNGRAYLSVANDTSSCINTFRANRNRAAKPTTPATHAGSSGHFGRLHETELIRNHLMSWVVSHVSVRVLLRGGLEKTSTRVLGLRST